MAKIKKRKLAIVPDEPQDDELEVDEVVAEEDEASVTFDIASYPSDLTLSGVKQLFDNGSIVVPEFQRNFVWKIKQSSLLIESFLLGLPVPQVFFYVDDENKNQVIDGQQRIMSVVYYLEGFFGSESIQGRKQVFRLQGLGEKSPFYKKRFTDLSESHQRKLNSAVLRAINIRQIGPKGEATSVYHIFERLNTGGTPLKAQEIRNVVFRGGLVGVLRDLNENTEWRQIVGKKTFDRHQKDVELILRIFGFSAFFDSYEKPMKEFLNKVMERERSGDSARVKAFRKSFASVAKLIVDEFGKKPFHIRGPLNAAALDAVFATLLMAKSKLPSDLHKRYKALVADKVFKQTTFYSTSDVSVVQERFNVSKAYLVD